MEGVWVSVWVSVWQGFFDDALRDANVRGFHLWSNVLTKMSAVAHSFIPIPWTTHLTTTSTRPQSPLLLAPLQAAWGN